MTKHGVSVVIVMADDDEDDALLTREALEESRLVNEFHSVANGAELIAFLRREGPYSESPAPRPHLILLDLNMPKMDGREALAVIKADPHLNTIPLVVLTTSNAEEDIARIYEMGASSYIQKPVSFGGMVDVMETLGRYWFEIVEMPPS